MAHVHRMISVIRMQMLGDMSVCGNECINYSQAAVTYV